MERVGGIIVVRRPVLECHFHQEVVVHKLGGCEDATLMEIGMHYTLEGDSCLR